MNIQRKIFIISGAGVILFGVTSFFSFIFGITLMMELLLIFVISMYGLYIFLGVFLLNALLLLFRILFSRKHSI